MHKMSRAPSTNSHQPPRQDTQTQAILSPPSTVLTATLDNLGNGALSSGTDVLSAMAGGALLLEAAGFQDLSLVPGQASLTLMREVLSRTQTADGGLDAARLTQRLAQNGGQPLPQVVRERVERMLGHGFAHVRIHTDASAADMALSLHAAAFTVGRDVYFARGQWAPEQPAGLELLVHELVHVLQADQGRLPSPSGTGIEVSHPSDPHEREAEQTAATVVRDWSGELDALSASAAEAFGPALSSAGEQVGGPDIQGEILSRQEEEEGTLSAAWGWILGVLAGDFNEDPSVSQIIVRTILTLIPYVDTVGDIEDLAAALYKLLWQERYGEAGVWFDLVITAIGFIPEAGSVVKGIVKILKKGLGSIDLGALLKILSSLGLTAADAAKHLDELIAGLSVLGASAGKWLTGLLSDFGKKLDETIDFLKRYGGMLPGKLSEKARALSERLGQLRKAVQEAAGKVEEQVTAAMQELGKRLDELMKLMKLVVKVGPADAAKLFEGLKKAGRLDRLKYCDQLDTVTLKTLAQKGDGVQAAFWKRSEAFHNSMVGLDPALQPKLIEQLAKKAPRPANPSYATKSLQHEWKHATDFGFPHAKPGNFKIKTDGPAFTEALNKHLGSPDAVIITGTYKGEAVTHVLDLATKNNVFYRADGSFWGGWRLAPAQLSHVLTSGNLK